MRIVGYLFLAHNFWVGCKMFLTFYIPQFPSWNDRVSSEFRGNFFQFNPFSFPVFVDAMTSHNVNSSLTD